MRKGTLTVLGKTYNVIEDNAALRTDGLLGMICKDMLEIRFVGDVPAENVRDTIMHEVLHAIDQELHLGLTEEKICSLSVGLCSAGSSIPIKWQGAKKKVKKEPRKIEK